MSDISVLVKDEGDGYVLLAVCDAAGRPTVKLMLNGSGTLIDVNLIGVIAGNYVRLVPNPLLERCVMAIEAIVNKLDAYADADTDDDSASVCVRMHPMQARALHEAYYASVNVATPGPVVRAASAGVEE